MAPAIDKDAVLQEIFAVIQRANELREPQDRLDCTRETPLFGRDGKLDSLGLVSLIVDLEAGLHERIGISIVLADDRAMSEKHNPFRNVESLAAYVVRRLEEAAQ